MKSEWLHKYLAFSNGRDLLKYFNHLPPDIQSEIIGHLDLVCPTGVTLSFPYLKNTGYKRFYVKGDIDDLMKSAREFGLPISLRSTNENVERWNQIPVAVDIFDLMLSHEYIVPFNLIEYHYFLDAIHELDVRASKNPTATEESLEKYFIALTALVNAREGLRLKRADTSLTGELKFACSFLKKAALVFVSNLSTKKVGAEKNVVMFLQAYAFFISCVEIHPENLDFKSSFIIRYITEHQDRFDKEVLLSMISDLLSEKTGYSMISGLSLTQAKLIDLMDDFDVKGVMDVSLEIDAGDLYTYHYITAETLAGVISANSMDTKISYKDISFDISEEMLCMLLKEYENDGFVSLKEINEVVEGPELEYRVVFRHFYEQLGSQYKLFMISGKPNKVYGARFVKSSETSGNLGMSVIEIMQISKDTRYQYRYIYN